MTVPPCEIPGFGKGALPPGAHEAESFLEEVEDVTRLVDGLRSGKVSAEYVDRVLREKDEETEKKETRAKEAKEQAEKTKYDNLPEEKKTEVREKVAEMMREKERRERARELYAKYQETLGSSGGSGEERRRTATTDYTSWDLWTPSDDEEDPWMTFTPGDNPAFKAMEADIDKRHERQVRQRQTAHRAREAGNAAFKAGQFAEALKTYEKGLESDKRSIELHGNAAMAALKCGCFAQTIEHCDRACELAEFFLERPAHPTAVKCLLRRAAARDALAHFAEAVADLERAAELDPDDGEIVKKLATARRRREDARAERALKRRLRNAKASTSRDGDGDGDGDGSEEDAFAQVVRLEKLMRRVGGSGGSSEDDGVVDYDAIEVLLAKHEACRVFARAEAAWASASSRRVSRTLRTRASASAPRRRSPPRAPPRRTASAWRLCRTACWRWRGSRRRGSRRTASSLPKSRTLRFTRSRRCASVRGTRARAERSSRRSRDSPRRRRRRGRATRRSASRVRSARSGR